MHSTSFKAFYPSLTPFSSLRMVLLSRFNCFFTLSYPDFNEIIESNCTFCILTMSVIHKRAMIYFFVDQICTPSRNSLCILHQAMVGSCLGWITLYHLPNDISFYLLKIHLSVSRNWLGNLTNMFTQFIKAPRNTLLLCTERRPRFLLPQPFLLPLLYHVLRLELSPEMALWQAPVMCSSQRFSSKKNHSKTFVVEFCPRNLPPWVNIPDLEQTIL